MAHERKYVYNIAANGKITPPGGLEPPTFRLTAERASQLRHGGFVLLQLSFKLISHSVCFP